MAINVNLCDCCNTKITLVHYVLGYEVCTYCIYDNNRFQYFLDKYIHNVGINWCNINK